MSAALGAVGPDLPAGFPVPAFGLRVGGSPLPETVRRDVVEVRVHQDVELPGMFTVRLIDWDADLRRATWSEPGLFDPGAPVEVSLGYVGMLQPVLSGEITGLELEVDRGRVPMLVVRGYDRRHRLMRGRLTRSFVQLTDSDIAQHICRERTLALRATPTTLRHEHVLQHNQTDLEFLTGRARRIGYEVDLDDRTLLFRPRREPMPPVVVLRRDRGLISFLPRLTTMGQTSGAAVQGWDPAQPDSRLRAVAGTDDPDATGGLSPPGAPVDPGALAVGNRTVIRPLAAQAEAAALADGLAGSTEPWRVEGAGTCIGHPDLRAGRPVQIDGLGSRFSGRYTVTAAVHTYDPSSGYRTAFEVRKERS